MYDKNSTMDNVDFSYVRVAAVDVGKCIKLLIYGKSPGVDGLTAEHYIHGLGCSLSLHIISVLTLCLRLVSSRTRSYMVFYSRYTIPGKQHISPADTTL